MTLTANINLLQKEGRTSIAAFNQQHEPHGKQRKGKIRFNPISQHEV